MNAEQQKSAFAVVRQRLAERDKKEKERRRQIALEDERADGCRLVDKRRVASDKEHPVAANSLECLHPEDVRKFAAEGFNGRVLVEWAKPGHMPASWILPNALWLDHRQEAFAGVGMHEELLSAWRAHTGKSDSQIGEAALELMELQRSECRSNLKQTAATLQRQRVKPVPVGFNAEGEPLLAPTWADFTEADMADLYSTPVKARKSSALAEPASSSSSSSSSSSPPVNKQPLAYTPVKSKPKAVASAPVSVSMDTDDEGGDDAGDDTDWMLAQAEEHPEDFVDPDLQPQIWDSAPEMEYNAETDRWTLWQGPDKLDVTEFPVGWPTETDKDKARTRDCAKREQPYFDKTTFVCEGAVMNRLTSLRLLKKRELLAAIKRMREPEAMPSVAASVKRVARRKAADEADEGPPPAKRQKRRKRVVAAMSAEKEDSDTDADTEMGEARPVPAPHPQLRKAVQTLVQSGEFHIGARRQAPAPGVFAWNNPGRRVGPVPVIIKGTHVVCPPQPNQVLFDGHKCLLAGQGNNIRVHIKQVDPYASLDDENERAITTVMPAGWPTQADVDAAVARDSERFMMVCKGGDHIENATFFYYGMEGLGMMAIESLLMKRLTELDSFGRPNKAAGLGKGKKLEPMHGTIKDAMQEALGVDARMEVVRQRVGVVQKDFKQKLTTSRLTSDVAKKACDDILEGRHGSAKERVPTLLRELKRKQASGHDGDSKEDGSGGDGGSSTVVDDTPAPTGLSVLSSASKLASVRATIRVRVKIVPLPPKQAEPIVHGTKPVLQYVKRR